MQRDFLIRFSFLFIIICLTFPVFSQSQEGQNWWFGNTSRGIQFSQPRDSAILVTRPGNGFTGYGNAGGAVASNPVSGGLLFYSDGATVYDATHTAMPNGSGLMGNQAGNQPAAISSKPGSTDQYFLITNSATTSAAGQIFLTEVDMTLGGNSLFPSPPIGDVGAIKAQPITGLDNESEAMIIIPHTNGTDYWLITHERGTSGYNISTITAAGVTAPATFTVPTGAIVPDFIASHFAYNAATQQLAVAPSDRNKNVLLYDFNPATGTLTANNNTILFGSAATAPVGLTEPAIYDIEFSPSGQYMYVSRKGDGTVNGLILQFDLLDRTVNVDTVVVPGMVRSFGLQSSPDSTSIYHIYQEVAGGPFLVGRIDDPDTVASVVNYEPQLFGGHNFNASQFPGFGQIDPSLTVDFDVLGTNGTGGGCQNTPTSFFPTITPGADSVVWRFGEGAPSTVWSPSYAYQEPGTYTVRLTAFANGDSAFVEKQVTITAFSLQVSLVSDTTACSCELNFPKATSFPNQYSNGQPCSPTATPFQVEAQVEPAATSYQWFGPNGALSGQNTNTLTSVDSAGYYYIVAGDGSGCTASAGVNIKEYGIDDPRSNVWHFGNNAGLNFNPDYIPSTGPDPIDGPVVSAEGVATISDPNGQAIISTNGVEAYDRDGNALTASLAGSQNATQSSLIVPFPGDPTLYYVFTTQEIYPGSATQNYELRYAIFDLKQDPNGQFLDPNGNPADGVSTVLFRRSTERITGNQNWLIAHEYGTNNFLAYPISAQGIGAPVVSSVGSVHSLVIEEHAEGYMKLGGNNILAVALSTPGVENIVEVFDFDNATGEITNARRLDLGTTAGQVYGIGFSGIKLYATTIGTPSELHEFAYDSTAGTYVKNVAAQAGPGELGAIETGPDGIIYVAVNGTNALSTITPDPDENDASLLNAGAQSLGGNTSTLGLPNFIQNLGVPAQTPSIDVVGNCHGLPTTFTGTGSDVIDTLIWSFGDNQTARTVGTHEVEHTYANPGTYTVNVTVRNRCKLTDVANLTTTVTISPIPDAYEGAMFAVICTNNVAIDATNVFNPDDTYLWSTGETTEVINPTAPGVYTVVATHPAGCADTTTWNVTMATPVDLGPDQTVCQNSGTITLDAQNANSGVTYEWRRNGTVVGTSQTFDVLTNTPSAAAEYKVTVDNPFNGCVGKDSVIIAINEDPAFDITSTPPTNCTSNDGEIRIQITNNTGTFQYAITGVTAGSTTNGPFSGSDQNAPVPQIVQGSLDGGAYNVSVINQVTGCSNQETVPLSEATFTTAIARETDCNNDQGEMQIRITNTPDPVTFTYRILSGTTSAEIESGNQTNNPTAPVPNGSYVAEVTATDGCVALSDVTPIRQDDEVPVEDVIVDDCNSPIRIEVVSAVAETFSWTENGNALPDNTSILTRTPPAPGDYTYAVTLTAPIGGYCPSTTLIPVSFSSDPPVVITQSDACTDVVTLSVTPTGNYLYAWTRNGTSFIGGNTIQLTALDNEADYSVRVLNSVTGCTLEPDPATHEAAVLGELTVTLTVPPACEGIDYTLTAVPNQAPDTYAWALDGETLPGQNSSTLTLTNDEDGLFRVRVARTGAGQSCEAEATATIVVNPVTPGQLPDEGIICPDDSNTDPQTKTVTLNPGTGFNSYAWIKDDPNDTLATTPTFVATETGTYTVLLQNIYNCPSTDMITLTEECDPQVSGPNAFRPEGTNKEFFLYTFFIDQNSFELFIFNRWGEMVFQSTGLEPSGSDTFTSKKWNGGYKNDPSQPLPPGTYTYLVKYKSSYRPELGTLEHRGGVVLLR